MNIEKSKDHVFIPELELIELSKQRFIENGEISYVLSHRNVKRLKRLNKLFDTEMGAKGKAGIVRWLIFIPNGIVWFVHSMAAYFFNSNLHYAAQFYTMNRSNIVETIECKYKASDKCSVISYVRG